MKIVQTPPKTGEEFIVAWFDDGEAKSYCFRYNNEHEMFEFFCGGDWWFRSDSAVENTCKNALIIIEG